MSSPTPLRTINAACHCGNAQFDITLPASAFPLPAHFCHCNSCRHVTGQLCTTAATLPASWQPAEASLATLRRFPFNRRVDVLFCPVCGTSLFAACRSDSRCLTAADTDPAARDSPALWLYLVCLGALRQADASVFAIQAHLFVGDTRDGGAADFLRDVASKPIPTYEKYVDGEEWGVYRRSAERGAAGERERLRAVCKCGGVEFWVARPTLRSVWPREAYEGREIPSGFPDETRLTLKAGWSKFPAAVCPCDSCRVAGNGMAFAAWAYIPAVDVSLDAEGEVSIPEDLKWGTLREYSFTDRTSQHFCGTCGAVVFWDTKARPWIKDFGLGLFDSPDGARCESWFHWRTGQMNHREDGLRRAEDLTLAMEKWLQEYEKNVQSKLPAGERRV